MAQRHTLKVAGAILTAAQRASGAFRSIDMVALNSTPPDKSKLPKSLPRFGKKEAAELTARLEDSRDAWRELTGEDFPADDDHAQTWAIRAGIPADVVLRGDFSLRDIYTLLAGKKLREYDDLLHAVQLGLAKQSATGSDKVNGLDQQQHILWWGGTSYPLTPKRWKLCTAAWSEPKDYEELREEVWDDDRPTDGAIKKFIERLNTHFLSLHIPVSFRVASPVCRNK